MSRFILIDHSLERVGGHHYEYAVHMLQAAERAGFEPVLATNKAFRRQLGHVPSHWTTLPLFKFDTYCRYASMVGRHQKKPIDVIPIAGRKNGPPSYWERFDRKRRLNAFQSSCGELFRAVGFEQHDQVFVPTLNEFDLTALVAAMASAHESQRADWHLQFHFGLFDGREPDYLSQTERLFALRRIYADALGQIPHHRLHFYTTTEQMSGQYNRLRLAPFTTLSYPVSAELSDSVNAAANAPVHRVPDDSANGSPVGGADTHQPLRVTCAGHIRSEKGKNEFNRVVDQLWDDCFATGDAQLRLQSRRRKFPELNRRNAIFRQSAAGARFAHDPIDFVRHPLAAEEYARLIRSSDIGLFLYSSDNYYARCSGIQTEMLAAGIPVIVPSGCWMSEQIAEDNFQYLEGILDSEQVVANVKDAAWKVSGEDGFANCDRVEFGGGGSAAVTCVEVPPGATGMIVSFRRDADSMGNYAELVCDQEGACRTVLDSFTQVAGVRDGDRPVRAMFRLDAHATHVGLQLSNRWFDGPIVAEDVELCFFASDEPLPLGSAGLIAGRPDQISVLLKDMICNHSHYASHARRFRERWSREHHPDNTLSILLTNTCHSKRTSRAA